MELVIVQIKNGFLLVYGQESIFCKDMPEVHREVEFYFGKVPLPPKIEEPKDSGVRQFSDED